MPIKETAVFIFAGFLDSGKTTALQGALQKTAVDGQEKSVLICTEQGEESYSDELLAQLKIPLLFLEDEEELTKAYFEKVEEDYHPDNVYIEFNGMWDLKNFVKADLPEGWYLATVFSLVDATTYDIFLKNMRQTLMNPLMVSDVILFNRCTESFRKGDARRAIAILNSHARLYFTKPDGTIDRRGDAFTLPNGDGVTEITEDLFCPWFVDVIENAENYYGKNVRFTAMVTRGEGLSGNRFYLGRYAAICCPADAQFIGFVAEYDGNIPKDGTFIRVEAQIAKGEIENGHKIILLQIRALEACETPEDIFIYF